MDGLLFSLFEIFLGQAGKFAASDVGVVHLRSCYRRINWSITVPLQWSISTCSFGLSAEHVFVQVWRPPLDGTIVMLVYGYFGEVES